MSQITHFYGVNFWLENPVVSDFGQISCLVWICYKYLMKWWKLEILFSKPVYCRRKEPAVEKKVVWYIPGIAHIYVWSELRFFKGLWMLSRKLFRGTIIQQSQTFVQPIEWQVWCPEEELPQEDKRPNWSARSGIWEEMLKKNAKNWHTRCAR